MKARTSIIVAVLSAALFLGPASPAFATGTDATPTTAPDGTAACLERIDRRVGDVGRLLTKVATAYDVTPEHRASLTASLQDAKEGLLALRSEIAQLAATTLTTQHEDPAVPDAPLTPELAAACARVYTDFRIYVLRKPQVNLVLAADRVVAQRALFDLLASELDAAIAASPADPDVGEARRLLDEYRAKIDSASLGAAGVPDAVIALEPGDWNADHDVLAPYADVMHQVKQDLRVAKKDARKIIALLSDGQGAQTAGKA